MEKSTRKEHWETIYATKALTEVSWYQATPQTSLDFIKELSVNKDSSIIDVGGGDSFLVDHLLELGYTNLTVLDISEQAIQRAKERLKEKAKLVNWVVCDILDYKSEKQFDFWHDRAAFHFLTSMDETARYKSIVIDHLVPKGKALIGTFAENGPLKCSGIEIHQYSSSSLSAFFAPELAKLNCTKTEHPTPFDTVQAFTFCSFEKQ